MSFRTELGHLKRAAGSYPLLNTGFPWWRVGDSNPRPLPCEGSALPTELTPHFKIKYLEGRIFGKALLCKN